MQNVKEINGQKWVVVSENELFIMARPINGSTARIFVKTKSGGISTPITLWGVKA